VNCPGPMPLPPREIPTVIQEVAAELCKEISEIGVSYQLAPWQTPTSTRAVVDTGVGPSVIRADICPRGGQTMSYERDPAFGLATPRGSCSR